MRSIVIMLVLAGCVEQPPESSPDSAPTDATIPSDADSVRDVAADANTGSATDSGSGSDAAQTPDMAPSGDQGVGVDMTAPVDMASEPDLPESLCETLGVPLGRWDMEADATGVVPNTGSGMIDALELGGASTAGPQGDPHLVLDGSALTPNIAHADALNLDRGTMAVWLRPHADALAGAHSGLIGKDALGQGTPGHVSVAIDGGTLQFRLQSPTNEQFLNSTVLLTANTWIHVAFTWQDGLVQLYQNGQLVDSAANGWTIAGNLNPIGLGYSLGRSEEGSHLPAQDYLKGHLDDFTIWDRVLTTDEMALLADRDCVVPSTQ